MKKLKIQIMLFILAFTVMGIQAQSPLCTPVGTNGQAGVFFDVEASSSITLTNLDGDFDAVGCNVEIWSRPGTHVGFEGSNAGWTLLGTATIVGGGIGNYVPIPITFSIPLNAGDRQAFHVVSTNNTSQNYATGSGTVGVTVTAMNAELTTFAGCGSTGLFGGCSFSPRNFMGCVHYSIGGGGGGPCYTVGAATGSLPPVLKSTGSPCGPAAVPTGTCDCPTGYVAVGYEGIAGNAWGSQVLNQFKLRCKQLNPDGTLGASVTVTCSNGTAVNNNTAVGPVDAGASQAMVGGQLRIGCAIDAVRGFSKPLSEVIVGDLSTNSTAMPYMGGTGGGNPAAQYVPNGNVIVGMDTYEDQNGGNTNNVAGGVAWRYAPIESCAGGGGGGCNATTCVLITCPPDETVACITDVDLDPLLAVATATCAPLAGQWVTNAFIDGVPGCPGTTYTFTYKAVDEDGNLGCCDRVITIDNTPPVVTVPAGGTVNCYDEISVDVNDAVVTNACADYELFLAAPEVSGEFGCPGTTYTFTYRLVESCGRVVEATQVFTEANNAAPVIVAPDDVTCSCLAGITPNPDNASVTTSCGSGSTVTVTGPQAFGPMNCNGTVYRYTYTVTDDCGRTSSDTQDFTISNGPPVFENCPGDNWLVLNCEDYGGEAGTIAVIEAWIASVTATTSCNFPLTVFNNFNPNNINTCVNNGYNTVTFRATDNCGRTSFCTGTYVVVDTEAPTITTPAQDHWEMCNYNTQANLTAWVQAHGGALATDGCSGGNISWQASPANPQINCIGGMGTTTVTVQFIVTDNCGNKSNTTATFNALMAPGNDLNDNGDDQINENKGLALLQNRPNPFKDETLISFNLPESTYATLTIYDVDGRTLKVVEGNYDAGYNEVGVNASELGATGVMYYRLMTDNGTVTKTMLVID
jgi:hypothetical protein